MGGKKNSKQQQSANKKQPAKNSSTLSKQSENKQQPANNKQPGQNPSTLSKQPEEDKKFVNLLHVYTIYKQKFRRISQEEFEKLLRHGCLGKRAAIELCKEFMKAKQIPDIVSFEKNVGFLSVPRLMPLIALLAERAGYKMKPSLVSEMDFSQTPERFKQKFSQLLVYGFWFLGRVISDSLSIKEQVNRGNMFNFEKGDLGFWWAGVRILDWNNYLHLEVDCVNCHSFVISDPPKYRLYTDRAIINMHKHPMYFLSELDWLNYSNTIKSIRHNRVPEFIISSSINSDESTSDDTSSSSMWLSESDISFIRTNSEASINTLASRESVD